MNKICENGPAPDRPRSVQARSPLASARYRARFQAEEWVRDEAIPVDGVASVEWDCTDFVDGEVLAYLTSCAQRRCERLDDPLFGVLDNDDVFKNDPAAPPSVSEWRGPFTIRVFAVTDTEGRPKGHLGKQGGAV